MVKSGKAVHRGIAMGPVRVIRRDACRVRREKIEDAETEILRLRAAAERAKTQLQELYEKALNEIGEAGAAVFAAYQMILEDVDYLGAIDNVIRTENVNAEYAAAVTGDNFSSIFASMDDEYMKERAADIKDVSDRLIRNLKNTEKEEQKEAVPSIIIADDLMPSETVQMDKSRILAFATVHGSANSHTAILARMMDIPALVGVPVELSEISDGTMAIVDGFCGSLTLEPTETEWEEAGRRLLEEKENQKLLIQLKGKENITLDGRKIGIAANIGSVSDVGYVLENDAGGIGLFRSEFLYLEKQDFPTEEEQFQAYRQVLQAMGEKKVVIRTMDIGVDKKAEYFHLPVESNPAMGYRAIRISLSEPEIFKTQLRALFRAAVYGNLSILYPLIVSVKEMEQIQEIVKHVTIELAASKIPYRVPEQGIMIETPAAVMISDRLAEIVDFFSIGTNDLTQYTLAVDRQNGLLDKFYDPYHEAVFRMIQLTVENAHKAGKWVGICGELAADPALTEEFIRMGVDELSVSPSMILKIRKKVRETEISPSCQERQDMLK